MNSLSSYIINVLAKTMGFKKLCNLNEENLLKHINRKFSKQKATPNKNIYKKYKVEELDVDGYLCYVVSSKEGIYKKSVIMLHGGAYIIEVGALNWRAVAKLIDNLNVKVYVPIYPLAPKATYFNAMEMVEKLYVKVLETTRAKDLTLLGDSAGAQITLSFCQYLKTLKLPQPQNMILLSPPLDNNPSQFELEQMKNLEKSDPLLTINLFSTAMKWWSKGVERNNYLVSPIYGDFAELGKISIFYSTSEILSLQISELKKLATKEKIDIDFFEGKEMIHCWPYLPFEEGEIAFLQIVNIIKRHRM